MRRFLEEQGYAHIIVRGVARMAIFEEPMDYKYYIKLMHRHSDDTGVTVCAYCLMENHVHLLVRYESENICKFMQKLGISYSKYFNNKYDRTGHLFQNRYIMEYVFDESYFLTVLRYIIQNPEKAGICKAQHYRWSSLSDFDSPANFVDISMAVEILGSTENFYKFVTKLNDDKCMEYFRDENRIEANVAERMRICLGVENVMDIATYDKKVRNESIIKLSEAGFSIRQIERQTGISRGLIHKVIQKNKGLI